MTAETHTGATLQTAAESRLAIRSTLLWGGIGLAVGGALPLLSDVLWRVGNPAPFWSVLPYVPVLTMFVLCVALLILGFGLPGESGIAGRSVVAKVAIVVVVAVLILGRVDDIWTSGLSTPDVMSLGWYFMAVSLIGWVAAITAAFAVQKAGVLEGIALHGAVVVVLFGLAVNVVPGALFALLSNQQVQESAQFVAVFYLLVGVAQIALGVVYAIQGWRMRVPSTPAE